MAQRANPALPQAAFQAAFFGLPPDGAAGATAYTFGIRKDGEMRFLITALVVSCTAVLPLPVQSAEPIRLVVVPFDATWGSRRLPFQPATLLPPPPLPGLTSTTDNNPEPKHPTQRWCRGSC